jgi:hypothetical protein
MPTATAETPLAPETTSSPAAGTTSSDAARMRHLPRRTITATSTLRAIDTRALDLGPQRISITGAGPSEDLGPAAGSARPGGGSRRTDEGQGAGEERRAVRSLSARELVTGAGTAAGAWTLAGHLGLLGTAGGTFMISLVSTIGVALVADSLTGARRMLVRLVRGLRERRAHALRTSRSAGAGAGAGSSAAAGGGIGTGGGRPPQPRR